MLEATAQLVDKQEQDGDYWLLIFECEPVSSPYNIVEFLLDHERVRLPVLFVRTSGFEVLVKTDTKGLQALIGPHGSDQRRVRLSFFLPPISSSEKLMIIAKDNEIGAAVFLAHTLKNNIDLIVLESSIGFPFKPQPSKFIVDSMPPTVMAAMPLLEDWHIPSRLCLRDRARPGCFYGTATALLESEPLLTEKTQRVDCAGFVL